MCLTLGFILVIVVYFRNGVGATSVFIALYCHEGENRLHLQQLMFAVCVLLYGLY